MYIHLNERCRRKEERSKQGQTNNKAKQQNTCYLYLLTYQCVCVILQCGQSKS